jgi:hypothetical protein
MEAQAEIEALKIELEAVCDALLSAAQTGLEMAADTPVDGEIVGGLFAEILGLCAFQDLAGQRLDRLSRALSGGIEDTRPDAHLLNGPTGDHGLDQAAADALFDR